MRRSNRISERYRAIRSLITPVLQRQPERFGSGLSVGYDRATGRSIRAVPERVRRLVQH